MDNPAQDGAADADDQVAWIMTPYQAPVLDSEGGRFGITDALLGDEAEDIFHGLAVKVTQGGHVVELSADHVIRITRSAVHTDVAPAAVALLPAYQQERWFHLGEGGLFRKRPEWKRD
jgi:hypothetical protein